MSVNHYLLPISDDELLSLQSAPESCQSFVASQQGQVESLGEFGNAITSLIAEDEFDELAFLLEGGPESDCGWVGDYAEEDGQVLRCQVDMGYGPASYYKNSFVRKIAAKIDMISEKDFKSNYDANWLDDNGVYPSGWHDEGRAEAMFRCFGVLRNCVKDAAKQNQHLLIWCA